MPQQQPNSGKKISTFAIIAIVFFIMILIMLIAVENNPQSNKKRDYAGTTTKSSFDPLKAEKLRQLMLNDHPCDGYMVGDQEKQAICSRYQSILAEFDRNDYCWDNTSGPNSWGDWVACGGKNRWFIAGQDFNYCLAATMSPAERIRNLQGYGENVVTTDKVGGSVEIQQSSTGRYWTYYPSMDSCMGSLPKNQRIPSRYR